MSSPTELSQAALKRMARYLRMRPRLVWKYDYQVASHLEVYTDTDWAGCIRTRKSTSGGCLLLGNHILKTWSATQASLALSSGEAEFYGIVRAAATSKPRGRTHPFSRVDGFTAEGRPVFADDIKRVSASAREVFFAEALLWRWKMQSPSITRLFGLVA